MILLYLMRMATRRHPRLQKCTVRSRVFGPYPLNVSMLSHEIFPPLSTHPPKPQAMVFLHGILGRGNNWRTFSRAWMQHHPEWACVLVDLRMHGQSLNFEPPHTIESAAADLHRLAQHLQPEVNVSSVAGHSLGGKIALQWTKDADYLTQTWVLDAMPGLVRSLLTRDVEVVMRMLSNVPPHFESRDAFRKWVQSFQLSASIAQWLAMNLQRTDGGYRWSLDLEPLRSLLESYFQTDLWGLLESPPLHSHIHIVVAGRSAVFDAERRAALQDVAGKNPEHISAHTLPSAGHWLHVDDPDGLLNLMR